MQYYVLVENQRYGPADVATLQLWINEGRLQPTSELEDTSGNRLTAASVPGLFFSGPSSSGSIPYTPMTPPTGSPWMNAPTMTGPMDRGDREFRNAMICSVIGFFCCAFVSIAGIVYGVQANQKGHPNGVIAIVIPAVALVAGVGVSMLSRMYLPDIFR
ncbi:MAG TPA: hypothetical protein PLO61_06245 [Fimbriimonadaceae bacterium]|nr:hypothetical protein [Fimbriimonadaceae bacterium]HRJ33149.1 hypothetical protein [Fimbriimonadaceae bacterium]